MITELKRRLVTCSKCKHEQEEDGTKYDSLPAGWKYLHLGANFNYPDKHFDLCPTCADAVTCAWKDANA